MTVSMVMYKAVDKLDNKMSLFAVVGDKMAVSSYCGQEDPWLSPESEHQIEMDSEFNYHRMQHPIVLLWASELEPVEPKQAVTMYKAGDSYDKQLSYFAVRGDKMAVTFVLHATLNWSTAETFGDFDDCALTSLDISRMIDAEMIWTTGE